MALAPLVIPPLVLPQGKAQLPPPLQAARQAPVTRHQDCDKATAREGFSDITPFLGWA